MTDAPSKGASLSQVRRRAARWTGVEVAEIEAPPPVQLTLVPAAPAPTPATKRAMTKEAKEQRLIEITDEAIAVYNELLAKPHGRLPKATRTGIEAHRKNVNRSVPVIKRICGELYGDTTIVERFWRQYFTEIKNDPFKSGNGSYSQGHENWTPTFEYLTRPAIVIEMFEKAVSR